MDICAAEGGAVARGCVNARGRAAARRCRATRTCAARGGIGDMSITFSGRFLKRDALAARRNGNGA